MMRWRMVIPVFVLAACTAPADQNNGIPSANGTGTATGGGNAVKEAQCLRDQGIPAGDPETPGGKPYIPESVTRQQLDAAMEHCREFAPDYGKPPPPMDPAQLELLRKFAQCMRDQGVDWADPGPDGRPKEDPDLGPGDRGKPARQDSQLIVQAAKICAEKVPGAGITVEGTDGPKGDGPK